MERRRSASLSFPVIAGKLRPPVAAHGVIARPRVTARLDPLRRVNLLVAPPGFGKTIAARQWVDGADRATAWLSIDSLDDTPQGFWRHFVRAVRAALPDVDAGVEATIGETAADTFLRLLMAQVERSAHDGVVVLDGVSSRLDRETFERLAVFVERVGERVRLVMTARTDPPLPLARWRAAGWVRDVDAEHLRLSDAEAALVAAHFDAIELSRRSVVALNRHVAGWPLAFHLALVTATNEPDAEPRAAALMAVDVLLRDYFISEVLDELPAAHRSAALALSVLEELDSELCHAIVGTSGGQVVSELAARHLLASSIADRPGTVHLQPMFRRLLAAELRWADPHRYARMNRRAAWFWEQRGDRNAAYRHLRQAGGDAADDLVMVPAIELAERDDRHGLAALVDAGPRADEVEHPGLALDLAVAAVFAGRTSDALRFCARAEWIAPDPGVDLRLRLIATRGLVALRRGDVDGAARFVEAFEEIEPLVQHRGPVERHFAVAGARVALARRDVVDARRWLDRTQWIESPAVLAHVTLPALEARFELLCGRVRTAVEHATRACARASELGVRPHAATVEAEITAATSRMASGELHEAAAHARTAMAESARLGSNRDRVRAALAAARIGLLGGGTVASVAGLRDLLLGIDASEIDGLSARIDLLLARAHVRANQPNRARGLVESLADRPQTRLVRAEIALARRKVADVCMLLEPATTWLSAERLEAELLLAMAARPATRGARLATTLEEAAATGWVSPFLGHSPVVEDVLRMQPLERLHPALALHLRRDGRPDARYGASAELVARTNGDHLTARELTILELLPSHLSYAQIAAQLYLSHNTVKSNLKSVYRKLGVTSRSQAVDAARAAGIIGEGVALRVASLHDRGRSRAVNE